MNQIVLPACIIELLTAADIYCRHEASCGKEQIGFLTRRFKSAEKKVSVISGPLLPGK